jgi:hypothetical protein
MNLVVLPLESYGWSQRRRFESETPALNELFAGAQVFENHVTPATSSFMTLSGFLHGGMGEIDGLPDFAASRPYAPGINLFAILQERGYAVAAFEGPKHVALPGADRWSPPPAGWSLWPPTAPPVQHFASSEELDDAVTAAIKSAARPFAFYVWNVDGHLQTPPHYPPLVDDAAARDPWAFVATGVRRIDRTVARVTAALQEHGLLDDTLVVAYGDHGDDYYAHAYFNGWEHSIPPYSTIVDTPLLFVDPRLPPARHRRIVSTVDLKEMLLEILTPEVTTESAARCYARETRTIAFSQSHLAAQQGRRRGLPFWRGYSATNASYHLLVTDRGAELYHRRLDPENHNNLLSFFRDRRGVLTLEPHPQNVAGHRAIAFGGRPEAIVQNYHQLADALRRLIEANNARVPKSAAFQPALVRRLRRRRDFTWINHGWSMGARTGGIRFGYIVRSWARVAWRYSLGRLLRLRAPERLPW